MNNWQRVKLQEVCHQITDGVHNTVIDDNNGTCLLLSCKNIKDGRVVIGDKERRISYETLQSLRKRTKTAKSDVLVSSVGTIGETAIIQQDDINYEFQRSVLLLKANPEILCPEFLLYTLKNMQSYFDSSAKGAVQKCLFIGDIKETGIDLPPFPEQKAIAEMLGSLEDKIEANRKENETLEAIAVALFKSWFVYLEPFGGQMPDDWRKGKLADIATITMGQSPSGESYNTAGVGKVFYQGRAEFGWRFPSNRLFTTEPKRMAEKGDVLLSVRAPVGDINIANENCCIGRGLSAIHSKYQSFVLYLLKTQRAELEQYNTEGTIFGCIGKDDLNGLKIIVPTEKVLEYFKSVCSVIDEKIFYNELQSRTLAQTRDALLPRLMSRKIRIPPFGDNK